MKRVITFGEIMMRLSPEGYGRLLQADRFDAYYGGAEANAAVQLASLGANAAFVSVVPAHDIGQCAINTLRRYGVDTQFVARGGKRLGIYYCEKGASQRSSKVIYDRAGSSITEAKVGDFDWDRIFDGADWFHVTGITPALGDNVAEVCLEACKKAKEHGVQISCDLNYRSKLWTAEHAGEVMREIMPYVDVCIANEEHADLLFGIRGNSDSEDENYRNIARQISERFGCRQVAITIRRSLSADDNDWSVMLYSGGEFCFSKVYRIHIVDRVGGGDSFAGALIYADLMGYPCQQAVDFAVAAGVLKHSIEGDFSMACKEEIEALTGGDGTVRMQR